MRFPTLPLTLLATAAVTFCGAANGQSRDEPTEDQNRANVLFNWYPQEGVCTAGNAESIKLRTLLTDTAAYAGACIKTSGYVSGSALFYRRTDALRENSSSNMKSEKRRLGIYANDEVSTRVYELEDRKVTVVGLIGNCSELYSGGYLMVSGYCHYSTGPIIGISSIED
ncbi:MAG: hypothetical protein ACK4P2_03500 [Hyphomonas sp.]